MKRTVLRRTCLAALLACVVMWTPRAGAAPGDQFVVWAGADAHVGSDLSQGEESLADAIRLSEASFHWDIMVNCGDMSGTQAVPDAAEGQELVRQYGALSKHYRGQVYDLSGNHDGSTDNWWYDTYGDPTGSHTATSGVDNSERPFAVTGTWERYSFEAGNILFLVMSDRNDLSTPTGRGDQTGGYPAGAVTRDTYNWWVSQIESNTDKIIVTATHSMLRETTVATGEWEGVGGEDHTGFVYHGDFGEVTEPGDVGNNPGYPGGAKGSSYIYFVIEDEGAETYTANAQAFETYLAANPGAVDLWLAGHTHPNDPDDSLNGRTITEEKWGTTFLNVAALTAHHAGRDVQMSRALTFTEGSDEVTTQVFLHSDYNGYSAGEFYDPQEVTVTLSQTVDAPEPLDFPGLTGESPVHRWAMDEGSGSTVGDSTGGAHGTLMGGSWVTDTPEDPDSGSALSFTGTNGEGVNAGDIEMGAWTDLSIAAWVKTDNDDILGHRVVSKDQVGATGNFILWENVVGSDNAWMFQIADSSNNWYKAIWVTDSLNDGEWHHLVGVVDNAADRVRLYVDGVQRASVAWTAATLSDGDNEEIAIGSDSDFDNGTNHAFDGSIDDAQIYSYALSTAQIGYLFDNPGEMLTLSGDSGSPVPEPGSLGLIGLAMLGLRKKRS
jgi:concanavalin A-like lectin/glucanase superfamily protein/PEP-CTERM motif-containing protein/calcineurin-like phosphoesterase family protein